MLWKTAKTIIWRFFFSLYALIAQAYRKKRIKKRAEPAFISATVRKTSNSRTRGRFYAIKKNPAKQSTWLDSLVAAMWFEHMTLRVWKIKIGNKRHGWRGGCEAIEDGSFVWIKHIYEYSKLTEISTVWKSRIVQNEVYTCEKHLSFNTKKQCAKNALCFFFLHDFIHTIFRVKSAPPLHPPVHQNHSVR